MHAKTNVDNLKTNKYVYGRYLTRREKPNSAMLDRGFWEYHIYSVIQTL